MAKKALVEELHKLLKDETENTRAIWRLLITNKSDAEALLSEVLEQHPKDRKRLVEFMEETKRLLVQQELVDLLNQRDNEIKDLVRALDEAEK